MHKKLYFNFTYDIDAKFIKSTQKQIAYYKVIYHN